MKRRLGQGFVLLVMLTGSIVLSIFGLHELPFWKTPLQDAGVDTLSVLGKKVECSPDLKLPSHAEILGYGLEDPRGLAYDAGHSRVWIADGPRRKLIAYSIAGRHFEKLPVGTLPEYCPQGSCAAVDLRGLALKKDALYVAEHDRARVAIHSLDGVPDEAYKIGFFSLDEGLLDGPSGVAFDEDEDTAFITDDHSRPGAVYQVEGQDHKAQLISKDVPNPSGVALSPDKLTLYVTTCDGQQVQWVVFRRDSIRSRWQKHGILASEKMNGTSIPPYEGILVAESGHIYAAGPGGIHVFNMAGASLGRMEFLEQVTGLTWGFDEKGVQRCIYFTAGHLLCRLHVEEECDLP